MDFNVVDAAVAAIVLISGILAYSRGLTREIFALVGWAVAFVVAYYAAPLLDPLMREAPVIGPFLSQSCIISLIAAFTLVVAATLLILSVFTPLVANAVLESALAPVDRVLGFVFGVARGALLVTVAYLIYANFAGAGAWPALENAASRQSLEEAARLLVDNLPEGVPSWFGEKVDALMVNCEGRAPAAPGTPQPPAETEAPQQPAGIAPATGAN